MRDENSDFRIFKLILPAGEIPVGSTVTKRTGSNEYVLKDEIRIFGPEKLSKENPPMIIPTKGGCRFLVSTTTPGDINAVNSDVELVWLVHDWQLRQFLDPVEEK